MRLKRKRKTRRHNVPSKLTGFTQEEARQIEKRAFHLFYLGLQLMDMVATNCEQKEQIDLFLRQFKRMIDL